MATLPPLVVVVDDDASLLNAIGRALRCAGFEPSLYSSAESFLTAPPSRPPICLVLDVRLTGMSGLELHRRLRSLGVALPVIVMSAFGDAPVREEAHRLGCLAYLDKQSDLETLIDYIRALPAARTGG